MSEAWIAVVLAAWAGVAWGIWYWRKINADGTISFDEIVEGVQEAVEHVEDIKEAIDEAKEE